MTKTKIVNARDLFLGYLSAQIQLRICFKMIMLDSTAYISRASIIKYISRGTKENDLKRRKKMLLYSTHGLRTKNWPHKSTPRSMVYRAQLNEGTRLPRQCRTNSTDWLGLSVQLVQASGQGGQKTSWDS